MEEEEEPRALIVTGGPVLLAFVFSQGGGKDLSTRAWFCTNGTNADLRDGRFSGPGEMSEPLQMECVNTYTYILEPRARYARAYVLARFHCRTLQAYTLRPISLGY